MALAALEERDLLLCWRIIKRLVIVDANMVDQQ
jgi:hypothetical protein